MSQPGKVTISKKKYEELLAAQTILETHREILAGKVKSFTNPEELFDDLDNSKNKPLRPRISKTRP